MCRPHLKRVFDAVSHSMVDAGAASWCHRLRHGPQAQHEQRSAVQNPGGGGQQPTAGRVEVVYVVEEQHKRPVQGHVLLHFDVLAQGLGLRARSPIAARAGPRTPALGRYGSGLRA